MIVASNAMLDRQTPANRKRPDQSRRDALRDRCMKELSRLDRLIIVLYYYEQLTTREVSLVLDLPEQQIETRRASLARRLGNLVAAA